jgi:LEA14-like dessication related protein
MEEKDFAKGLFVKESNVDFVKFKISIKKDEFTQWYKEKLQNKDEDWINLDVKESKEGKWYTEVNTWKPKSDTQSVTKEEKLEDIPF